MLSCGHEPSPHGPHTTGTAHTVDGREVCWTCSHAMEVAALLTRHHYMAYLTKTTLGYNLTDWPGGKLATVTDLAKRQVGFGGMRYYFRAVDVHGQAWYGNSPGEGMYARMHRGKA